MLQHALLLILSSVIALCPFQAALLAASASV